jgi:hypothetical protein
MRKTVHLGDLWLSSFLYAHGLTEVRAVLSPRNELVEFLFTDHDNRFPRLLRAYRADVGLQQFIIARKVVGRLLAHARIAGWAEPDPPAEDAAPEEDSTPPTIDPERRG